jgi:hypothetical protein
MSLATWKGKVYLKYSKRLFCWESHWNIFRPIESIDWNGEPIWQDRDIFSATYGFGSEEMKKVCDALTDKFQDKLEEAISLASIEALWSWAEYPLGQWVFDRRIVHCACEEPTRASWTRFLETQGLRRKTLKQNMRKNTYTKHRLPK